jgi:hypothetical protein
MQKESPSLVGLADELKKQAGVSLKSRADVDAYLAEHARAVRVPKHSPLWTSIKHGVLAVGLALAFFQYYMLGVYVEIVSLPSITFLSPPSAPPIRSGLDRVRPVGSQAAV